MIMQPEYLGCMHQTRISFSRALIRKMIAEKWKIKNSLFELDEKGFGYVTYEIYALDKIYTFIIFSEDLPEEIRNDRVIAEKWDLTCSLYDGLVQNKDIDYLRDNITRQESGRFDSKVLTLSRANKSMRIFKQVIDSLSTGKQPDIKNIRKIGYLIRTTAVYGNGKFGISDFPNLKNTPLSYCFSAQMLTVYLLRHFCIEWIEHIAKNINRKKFVKLSSNVSRFLGVGNSTGLGMAPFLIKHPFLINQWFQVKEQLIEKILTQKEISEERYQQFLFWLKHCLHYFEKIEVIDKRQNQKNILICYNLKKILKKIQNQRLDFKEIETYIQEKLRDYETLEVFYSVLLEIHPEWTDRQNIQEQFLSNQCFELIPNQKIIDFWYILNKSYSWALEYDFTLQDENHYFWYRSEEKEEPRLGERYIAEGEDEKEVKIDIARQVWYLNQALLNFPKENLEQSISFFLIKNPKFRTIIARVQSLQDYPYAEIRGNILKKGFIPIDILRAKLAFFGAVKFDPKSDKWLRITLFQGSPLIVNEQVENKDNWFMYFA